MGVTELIETYPKILEWELKRDYSDRRFEVLNFGIEGTDSRHHLSVIKQKILPYAPDLIILGYSLNDIRFSKIYDKPILMCFLQHSYFADFIAVRLGTAISQWQYAVGSESEEKYYLDHIALYDDKERLSKLKNILKEVRDILGKHNIRFAVVVFPFRQQLDERDPKPQKVLSSILREEKIPFFDPLTELKSYQPDELYPKGDFVHFSSFGNEAAARSIKSFILSKKLL